MGFEVDALFRVKTDMKIEPWGQKRWLRTIGAVEHDIRNQRGLEASIAMSKALEEGTCFEAQRHLDPLNVASREELEDIALSVRSAQLRQEAQTEVYSKHRPEKPEGGDLTELIEWQKELEEIDAGIDEEREKWIEDSIERYRKGLSDVDDKTLLNRVRDMRIANLCNRAFAQEWDRSTLAFAVYMDEKFQKRMFSSPEEVGELNPVVYGQLWAKYQELDRFSVNGGRELKNVPSPPPSEVSSEQPNTE